MQSSSGKLSPDQIGVWTAADFVLWRDRVSGRDIESVAHQTGRNMAGTFLNEKSMFSAGSTLIVANGQMTSGMLGAPLARSSIGRCVAAMSLALLAGCAALPAAGPSTRAVVNVKGEQVDSAPVQMVDVTEAAVRRIAAAKPVTSFSSIFGDGVPVGKTVGSGDVLDISIWEAPPAALFGTATGAELLSLGSGAPLAAKSTSIPEQMISVSGTVTVPFAGTIQAAGRAPEQIASDIRSRLIGKAHDPQVIVRLARNAAANVTIVGEVANSLRMPLTAKGERLLDALASAGGVKQPVGKMTIQLTRGDKLDAMALDTVIRDPKQNIRLQAGDVLTLLFQPYSFTTIGATGANQEFAFEGTGVTLSQALGRMGGVQDQRANPKGVFIFRFEDPAVFAGATQPIATTKDGKVPVIYRVNLKDPKTLFVAQSFFIKDKDIVYVSNAPLGDFQKFLQALSQIVYPVAVIQTTNIF